MKKFAIELDDWQIHRLIDSAQRILRHAEYLQELHAADFADKHPLIADDREYLIRGTLENIAEERATFNRYFRTTYAE